MSLVLEERIAQVNEIRALYEPIPHLFVKDALGATPWDMQDKIIQSVFVNKITAVKTCNAVGKSYIAARIALTFLTLYPGSIVVTTAPTWRQVKDILWREFAVAVKRSKVKLTDKDVKQAGLDISEDWYAVGLSTKYPENFFGYHADHILVIVDEAGGVEEPIFKGVAAITPNINARVLLIGNPTDPSGTFYEYFQKPELGAKCFTISAFDSPNFIATGIRNVKDLLDMFTPPEGVEQVDFTRQVNEELKRRMNPIFGALIDPSVVYSRFHEWGTDSPAWQSLVMGEFPTQADQALIPINLVTMAMNMYGIDEDTGKTYAEISGWKIPDGPPSYGQDMARFGSDRNVLVPKRGGWVDTLLVWSKVDLMESADRILNVINPLDKETTVNIDDTGNGGGTTDRLRQISGESFAGGKPAHQYTLNAYNFSSKEFMNEKDQDKFYDITSMLYWNLRQQFYDKKIALPFDRELFDELVGRRWFIVPGGKIKVESKDDYKKRTGGKSPDKSDALALAFAPNRAGSWEPSEDKKKPSVYESPRIEEKKAQTAKPYTSGVSTTRY